METEIKKIFMTLLIPILLVACSIQPTEPEPTTSHTAIVSTVTLTTPALTPTQTADNDAAEEAEIRGLVEEFGKTLQTVSLLSPDAEKEMEKRYAEFVSPALLERWISDVSSPWPDRFEITTLSKEGSDRYVMTGFVVEVTSVEVANGGAAAKIPVHIVVQKIQWHWLITEFTEER